LVLGQRLSAFRWLEISLQSSWESLDMVIRVIYAPLTGAGSDDLVFTAAGVAARQFAAHVDVVFQCADPRAAIPYLGEGISGDVVAQFIESVETENAALAQRAHTEFDAWRGRAGLALADAPAGESSFEASLIHSGRPVLLVKSRTGTKVGERVLIAWNGSAEASRAIASGLPFLREAEEVIVLVVPEGARGGPPLDQLIAYLGCHGVKAAARHIEASDKGVGKEILSQAEAAGIDLLIMGAYTHSRLRHLIFGGATSAVLDHTNIPVLMAH